ncbi:hypothetical protein BK146_29445 [Paenibacillus sp. FSL R7-0333]|nr:hypothetical protein BK146_29445 [Paenibacillus sp. FSL R7-0333]
MPRNSSLKKKLLICGIKMQRRYDLHRIPQTAIIHERLLGMAYQIIRAFTRLFKKHACYAVLNGNHHISSSQSKHPLSDKELVRNLMLIAKHIQINIHLVCKSM